MHRGLRACLVFNYKYIRSKNTSFQKDFYKHFEFKHIFTIFQLKAKHALRTYIIIRSTLCTNIGAGDWGVSICPYIFQFFGILAFSFFVLLICSAKYFGRVCKIYQLDWLLPGISCAHSQLGGRAKLLYFYSYGMTFSFGMHIESE